MIKKKIQRLIICRTLSLLGDQMLLFSIPLLIFHTTQSVALTGIAFFVEWLPRLVSLPLAGAMVDRFTSKTLCLFSDGVRAFMCFGVYSVIHYFHWSPSGPVILCIPVAAFCYAQSFVSLESALPKLASRGGLVKAQSVVQSVEQTMVILGPLLCGVFLHGGSVVGLLALSGGVFLMSAWITLSFLPDIAVRCTWKVNTKSVMASLRAGLSLVRCSPILIRLVALTLILNLVWGLVLATNVVWVVSVYHKSASVYSLLQMGSGIFCVSVFVVLSRYAHRINVLYLGMFAFSCVMAASVVIGMSHHWISYVIAYVLVMSSDGLFNVYIRSERARHIPPEDLGKATGVIVLLNQLSLPISGLFMAFFHPVDQWAKGFILVGFIGVFGIFFFKSVDSRGRLCAES